jgi:drug/metabolite transporter (DMT)-like permease
VASLGAQLAGQYIHMMPFFGVILATAFLDEAFTNHHLIAGGLIAAGLYLALRQSYAVASKPR